MCWIKAPASALHHSFLLLTVCDLQQCFGNNAASDVESLAAVEAAIRALNIGNGQTAHLGDRQTAKGLWWLVREQETLERRKITELVTPSYALFALSGDLVRRQTEGQSHLTALPLPEDSGLWVASGLTLEGDRPTHCHHLVPGAYGKCWGHCRGREPLITWQPDTFYIIPHFRTSQYA